MKNLLIAPAVESRKELERTAKARRASDPREADILRACLRWLESQGILAWRANCGASKFSAAEETPQFGGSVHNKARYVKFGAKGQADITGVLPGGQRLEIEVKRPGQKPTPEQLRFGERILACGGRYIVATCVADLEWELGTKKESEPCHW